MSSVAFQLVKMASQQIKNIYKQKKEKTEQKLLKFERSKKRFINLKYIRS